MAKRYHQSKKSMKRSGGMISDDASAPAMLPRHVMEKEYGHYPVSPIGSMSEPDLYTGVERQMKEDASAEGGVYKASKY